VVVVVVMGGQAGPDHPGFPRGSTDVDIRHPSPSYAARKQRHLPTTSPAREKTIFPSSLRHAFQPSRNTTFLDGLRCRLGQAARWIPTRAVPCLWSSRHSSDHLLSAVITMICPVLAHLTCLVDWKGCGHVMAYFTAPPTPWGVRFPLSVVHGYGQGIGTAQNQSFICSNRQGEFEVLHNYTKRALDCGV